MTSPKSMSFNNISWAWNWTGLWGSKRAHEGCSSLTQETLHTSSHQKKGPQRILSDAEDSSQTLWFTSAYENNSMGRRLRDTEMMRSKAVPPKHGLYSWTHLQFSLSGTSKTLPGVKQPTLHHTDWHKPVLLCSPCCSSACPLTVSLTLHTLDYATFCISDKCHTCIPSTEEWLWKSKWTIWNPGLIFALGCLLQYLSTLK